VSLSNPKEKTMKYLLLLYQDEKVYQQRTPEENEYIFNEYMDFTRGIYRSGNYVAGEALQPIATARTVRQREGKTLTTDGPFAETKEQLGGFYLVEAADLDEATRIANRIPIVRTGSVEVRPILPTPPVE
jgi:hypothetical protein